MSFDDNITTTAESFTTNISGNISCDPSCYTLFRPTPGNDSFTTKLLYTLIIVLLASVITTSLVVFIRYYQHSYKRSRKGKEFLQGEKICAQPFEDVLLVDETKSIELTDVIPTTVTN